MRIEYTHYSARSAKHLYITGRSDDGIHFEITDIVDDNGKAVGVGEEELKTIEVRGWELFYEEITEHSVIKG